MIEYFRHEAMNQATVIAGFCEIIENLLVKQPFFSNNAFLPVLHKVEQLVRTFNDTLSVFREECMLIDATEEAMLSLDPAAEISAWLSESCRVRFSLLRDIADELDRTACSIETAAIENETIRNRYSFVCKSAARLDDLFLHPVAFLQKAIIDHRQ
ncbi:MAG: hypothetical protein JW913_01890 [Chitinispirillaceae bacterium]|nr:hypothetical protein [Chitinispirillaceae bacterium]